MALFAWGRVFERRSLSNLRNGLRVAADSVFPVIAVLALAWASVIGAIPGRGLAAFRPDIVVAMEVFAGDFVRKTATLPSFSDYVVWWKGPVFAPDLAISLPETLWGSRWTVVFARAGRCRPTVGLVRR
jgi:hypothetical protein